MTYLYGMHQYACLCMPWMQRTTNRGMSSDEHAFLATTWMPCSLRRACAWAQSCEEMGREGWKRSLSAGETERAIVTLSAGRALSLSARVLASRASC